MTEPEEMTVTLRVLDTFERLYSNSLYRGQVALPNGDVRNMEIWFPIRDRRIARKIARKTGRRFRREHGAYAIS